MKTFIDFIYTVLVGVAVAVFVGFGIWSFYPGPKGPDYPLYSSVGPGGPTAEQEKEFQQKQASFDQERKDFDKKNKPYSKKVSGIALGTAIIFYGAGLWLYKRKDIIGEGLALGGIFTALYAAIRAGIGNSRSQVFLSITVLLLMLIGLVLYRSGSQLSTNKK